MQSWWNKNVEDLSKGMSQKLQFVITVLHEPKLIILDEPFSGLDPLNANLIKDEIYALAKKGATIIFSTHRMEQVEEICDHIVLVNLGKKILDGTVSDIKQQFKEYIFAIETSQPSLIKDNTLFSILDKADKNPNKILVKLNQAVASNEVLKYLIEQNIPIISYNEVLPSLNDIFIQLVEDTHAKARAFQHI
jgi:ABC-2 type transport system ATP-binding protein